ncbi:MAG: FtsX-like permease family protein [Roseivirga sp.]|nr:FtsX-like permease family protein [Roseivirga sp.]
MNEQQPPKWATRFLRIYCRDEFREEIEGDAFELFEVRLATLGAVKARWLFIWDVIRFFRWSNIKKLNKVQLNSIDMYKNYIKIAWRGLVRSKLYSTINIAGMAVAMAVFMLIFLYVTKEISYDKYHVKADRIQRVVSNLTVPGSYFEFALTPPNLGKNFVKDFPEVLDQVRLMDSGGTLNYGDNTFSENSIMYTDPTFFEFFDIPLLQGNKETVLSTPYSLVLTESTATKYFDNENPIGKIITMDGVDEPFSVTGVMADVPDNTHFEFGMLASMATRKAQGDLKDNGQWFYVSYYTYLLFPEGYDVQQLESKLPDFIERNIGDAQRSVNQSYEFEFQKLPDIHLYSHRDAEAATNGDIQYVYIFSIIALFIVLIACVNFMNLSTSRASQRAKEIGVRKVVGALRRQLIAQFLTESIVLSLFSFVLAFLLVLWTLPSFNNLVEQSFLFVDLFEGGFVYIWPALMLVIGLLAGFYPALVLSGFSPISVLKSSKAQGQSNVLLRKSLVVFQLVISTVLIIGTLVINAQLKNMQNQNLGFNQDQLVLMNYAGSEDVIKNMESIRTEFKRTPGVSNVSFSSSGPAMGFGNWYTEYETVGGETQNASMYGYLVDHDFIETYGLELITGRGFDRAFETDMDEAFVINEQVLKEMGLTKAEDAIGKWFSQFGKKGKVVGVVKDFNFRPLYSAIEPLVIHLTNPQFFSFISVRLDAGSDVTVLAHLEKVWDGIVEAVPFEVTFMDEALNEEYFAEIRTRKILSSFSSLAIFIAALGLFALSTLSADQQRKNISIRKVLGAKETDIAYRFSSGFFKLAMISLLISVPIAYFASESWLANFTYRIGFDPVIFILGGAITTVITLLTVSFQSFRITRLNPAQNLRSE